MEDSGRDDLDIRAGEVTQASSHEPLASGWIFVMIFAILFPIEHESRGYTPSCRQDVRSV
jgi:hypothetical protein